MKKLASLINPFSGRLCEEKKHEDNCLHIGSNVYFVMAGDIYVGQAPECLKTTLGSCIALTAWHPVLKVGGMCHYLLSKPSRGEKKKPAWYYGDSALQELEARLQLYAPLKEFEYGLFGGGSLFFKEYEKEGIAYSNIEEALAWLDAKNIVLKNFSIGGCECRSISLDLQSGEIALKVYMHERLKPAAQG